MSPTDVSPTESSWMLRPFNKASLEYCVPDRSVPTLDRAPSAAIAASVGLQRLMDQWGVWPASPTPLTRFIGLAPLRLMHARPTHRTRSAEARGSWKSGVASLNQIKGMGWFGRGKLAKGHVVQGMQHPRIFGRGHIGRGHIGRGWTNIAPISANERSSGGQNDDFRPLTYTLGGRGRGCRDKYVTC